MIVSFGQPPWPWPTKSATPRLARRQKPPPAPPTHVQRRPEPQARPGTQLLRRAPRRAPHRPAIRCSWVHWHSERLPALRPPRHECWRCGVSQRALPAPMQTRTGGSCARQCAGLFPVSKRVKHWAGSVMYSKLLYPFRHVSWSAGFQPGFESMQMIRPATKSGRTTKASRTSLPTKKKGARKNHGNGPDLTIRDRRV